MGWTYFVTDFRTGRPIQPHLPMVVNSFSDYIGVGAGTLSGQAPLSDGFSVEEALLPWRRVIWPCKDGVPYGAFVVTARGQFGPRSTAIPFTATRVDTIFNRREVESTLVFRQVDQLDIARDLMRYALGRIPVTADIVNYPHRLLEAADLPWLRLDDSASGVFRDRLDNDAGYQAAKHPKVGQLLTNLCALEGGFEYRLSYGRDPAGVPYATVELGYPTLGRTSGTLPLQYPGNLTDWREAGDTADTETHSRVYGAGQGVEKLAGAEAVDRTALAQGWPLLMGSASSTAIEQTTLDAASRIRLGEHMGENRGWVLTLSGDALGKYQLGDVCDLHVKHTRWPAGRRAKVRIVGHKVTPWSPGVTEVVSPIVTEVPG